MNCVIVDKCANANCDIWVLIDPNFWRQAALFSRPIISFGEKKEGRDIMFCCRMLGKGHLKTRAKMMLDQRHTV